VPNNEDQRAAWRRLFQQRLDELDAGQSTQPVTSDDPVTIKPHDPRGVVEDRLYVDNRGSVFGCLTCAVLSDDPVTIEPHDPRCARLHGHIGPCPTDGPERTGEPEQCKCTHCTLPADYEGRCHQCNGARCR
jgi:hypothetical protein